MTHRGPLQPQTFCDSVTHVLFAWELHISAVCGPEAGEGYSAQRLDRGCLAGLRLVMPPADLCIFLKLSRYHLQPAMK